MWPFSNQTINDLKNRAYIIYLEFNPTPEKYFAEQFPQVDESVRNEWLIEFNRLNLTLYELTKKGWAQTHNFETFRNYIKDLFPFLSKASLKRAWALVRYNAIHDGYPH